jgi:glycerol-3-phosphate dehydrogenase (NAD(P)+)
VKSDRVIVVGDGAMGTTCAMLLAHNRCDVVWWGVDAEYMAEMSRTRRNPRYLPDAEIPEALRLTGDAAAVGQADWIVSAVPCQFVRRVWERLKPHVPADVPVCSITKGIEIDTLLPPTGIIADVIGPRPMAVLSGPCIAPEVVRRLPAALVVASEDDGLAIRVQRRFVTPWFRVYTNRDIRGVELAGAVKNVVAIAAGIIDGLGMGNNCKAALLSRGLVEITRLGVAMGADRDTFAGLAGLGDLVTTCISPVGRNRSCGEQIGRGKTRAQVEASTKSVIEGIATTRSVVALAQQHAVEMPITHAVHSVLFEDVAPTVAIERLMTRELKAE